MRRTKRCGARGLIALLLLWVPCSAGSQDSEDWTAVWDAVGDWRARVESEQGGVIPEPTKARELATGRGDSLRSALLGALIGEVVRGENSGRSLEREIQILPPDEHWRLTSRESWMALDALPTGSVRSEVARRCLEVTTGAWSPAQISSAYRAGVEAAEDLRLEEAISIQQPLHDRVAEEWSAFNLALSLRRTGLYQRADRVLDEQIAKGASADLYSQRGLNSLGSGNVKKARTHLGAALARGSMDAAVMLARLDLADGEFHSARAGFRAVLAENSTNAWARRGWGVAQVQRPLPQSPVRSDTK